MVRKKTNEADALRYEVKTRVNQACHERLQELLLLSRHRNISSLVRHILSDRPVTVYTVDHSIGATVEELSRIRIQVHKIGVNINQVIRDYHASGSKILRFSLIQELTALQEQLNIEIKTLEPHIQQLTSKWLLE